MLRIKSHVRPGFVLMVGVLLGGMAVVMAPAAVRLLGGQPEGAEGVIIKTRTASCSGANFVPANSFVSYQFLWEKLSVVPGGSGDVGTFFCNPALPSKATVTKVVFDVWDTSADGEVQGCGLTGYPVDASFGGAFEMAYVNGTGISETPYRPLLVDTSIQNNPTNNAVAGYALWCTIDGESAAPYDEVGLFGASITYKISAGNG